MSGPAPPPLTPEHTQGFSSLALLAPGGSRRVLYLLAWPSALAADISPDGRTTSPLPAGGWTGLPLDPASVDAVIADLDSVPGDDRTRRGVLAEIRRVLAPGGRCIAVVTHRRRPRDARRWSQYRLVPPADRWRPLVREAGFAAIETAHLTFDGERLTAIDRADDSAPGQSDPAGALALLLSAAPPDGAPAIIDAVADALAHQTHASRLRIERLHVRKIGKVAAYTSAGGQPAILRLPCSPIALARAACNQAALSALASDPPAYAGVVPRPLAQGEAGGQPYFVETRVPGVPREDRIDGPRWEPQALGFITGLHQASARPSMLSPGWFAGRVEPPLAALEGFTEDAGARAAIAWARESLRAGLVGRTAPLVRSHGDFTGGNCLYDPDGRLTGVVDWELSAGDALPLLDLVQSLDLPSEYTPDDRWQRAEIVFDAIEGHGRLHDSREVARYLEAVEVPQDLVPHLLLFHWIEHAGTRIHARHADARWMARRVRAPLARLARLARTQPAGAPRR